ncbi:MAG: hypothetical protein AAGE43_17280 [Pseudomonadota bacterium]
MRLSLRTELPCSYEAAVHWVKRPALLFHIAWPLVRFLPEPETAVGAQWEEGTHWYRLRLFTVLPFGRQAVRISFDESADRLRLRDNGYSRLIPKWDHLITIERAGDSTHYRDDLELDAGILAPVIWVFARGFYAHRQRRWRQLARDDFRALDP